MTSQEVYTESLDSVLGEIANLTRRIRRQRVNETDTCNPYLLRELRSVRDRLTTVADSPLATFHPTVTA